MTRCEITPLGPPSSKACSGKCKSTCSSAPRVWVVTACEGMISLFEKDVQGKMHPLHGLDSAVFSSLEAFQNAIEKAEDRHRFDQLVIIGSGGDIAWVHASLPSSATRHIVAEIEYPLLPAWFKQPQPLPSLARAIEGVFNA